MYTFDQSNSNLFVNIYTTSVFCYDEHEKNFDIHLSMKKRTWRMSRLLRRLFQKRDNFDEI